MSKITRSLAKSYNGGSKPKIPSALPIFQSPLEDGDPGKEIETPEDQPVSCSQSSTAELHHNEALDVLSIIKHFVQVDVWLFQLTRFCYDKRLQKRPLQECVFNIVIRNGKIFVSNDYALKKVNKYF